MAHSFSVLRSPRLESFKVHVRQKLGRFRPGAITEATFTSERGNWSDHLREPILDFPAQNNDIPTSSYFRRGGEGAPPRVVEPGE